MGSRMQQSLSCLHMFTVVLFLEPHGTQGLLLYAGQFDSLPPPAFASQRSAAQRERHVMAERAPPPSLTSDPREHCTPFSVHTVYAHNTHKQQYTYVRLLAHPTAYLRSIPASSFFFFFLCPPLLASLCSGKQRWADAPRRLCLQRRLRLQPLRRVPRWTWTWCRSCLCLCLCLCPGRRFEERVYQQPKQSTGGGGGRQGWESGWEGAIGWSNVSAHLCGHGLKHGGSSVSFLV